METSSSLNVRSVCTPHPLSMYTNHFAQSAHLTHSVCTPTTSVSLHTSPTQIHNKSKYWSLRVTVDRRVVNRHDASRRPCRQQAPSSTSFVDNAIDLPWRNFLRPEIGQSSRGSTLIFGDADYRASIASRGKTAEDKKDCWRKSVHEIGYDTIRYEMLF